MVRSSVLALLAAAGCTAVADDDPTDRFRPLEAVLQLRDGRDINTVNARYGFTTLAAMPQFDLYLVQMATQLTEDELEDIRHDDDDVYQADLNYVPTDMIPDPGGQDFFLSSDRYVAVRQDLLFNVGAPWANVVADGSGVIVAVIDTGVDLLHSALDGALAPGAIDFVDGDNTPMDEGDGLDTDADGDIDEMVGHGTFAAGVVRLIAPGASILPIRVLDSDGDGSVFTVAAAVYYAADNGARVINLSLGTLAGADVIDQAVEAANLAGCVVVAATGNDSAMTVTRFPAASTDVDVIAVTAVDNDDLRAPFGNIGALVDLAAPGVRVVGPTPGNAYGEASGTSWAAPIVAGVAAMVIESHPDWTPAEVLAHLAATATPIDALNPGLEGLLGAGRIDAAAAVGAPSCKNPADIDLSGSIDTNDFFAFLTAYQAGEASADFEPDGVSNTNDFFAYLAAYGAGC